MSMEKNNSSKHFSYLSIGRITATFLQAVFFLIIASILDPEQYGILNVTIALAGTFSVFSRFGMANTLQIYRAKNNTKTSEQINTLFVLSTSVAAIVLVTIDPLAAVLCIAMSFFAMNLQNLLGLKLYKQFMIFSIFKSATFIFIPVILYFIFEIPGIVLGMAISHFIASIPYFKQLRLKSFFELKNIYKVIIHNFGVDSAGNLSFMLDKLLIAYLFGVYLVGIYQFNLQIFLALGVLPGILLSFLLTEESSGKSYRKLNFLIIFASVALATVIIILAPVGVTKFFPQYLEGILGLQILVISIIPSTIQSILNAKLMVQESTKVGFSAIIRIGSLLPLLAFLGQLYGLVGLSLAVLLSIIFNTIFLFVLYKRAEYDNAKN